MIQFIYLFQIKVLNSFTMDAIFNNLVYIFNSSELLDALGFSPGTPALFVLAKVIFITLGLLVIIAYAILLTLLYVIACTVTHPVGLVALAASAFLLAYYNNCFCKKFQDGRTILQPQKSRRCQTCLTNCKYFEVIFV